MQVRQQVVPGPNHLNLNLMYQSATEIPAMEAAMAMTSLKLKLPKVLPPHFYAGSQMEGTDGGWLAIRRILADIIITIGYMARAYNCTNNPSVQCDDYLVAPDNH